jgi:hypothetical protein
MKDVMEYMAPITTAVFALNVKALNNVNVLGGNRTNAAVPIMLISLPAAKPQSADEPPIESHAGYGIAGSSQR